MRLLNCTEEEADDVIETDRIIDKGGPSPYDLSAEAEKEARKYINIKTKTVYNFTPKEKKENPTKGKIVAEIADFLTQSGYDNVEITNKERMIAFSVGETNFEVTLIQKRKAKK